MILRFQVLWPIFLLFWIALLIVIPGYLIAYLLWQRRLDSYERVGISFALGYLLFSLYGLLAYLFRLSLEILFWTSFSTTILLGLIISFAHILKRVPAATEAKKPDWRIGISLVSVALIGALVSFGSGWYPRGDAAIHLQAIRKILSQANITQPIYSLDTKHVICDHAYDTYYLLVATITKRSGLELTVVWHYISGILALLLPFVIYAFLKSLRAGKSLIFASLFFFLLIAILYPRPMYGTVFDALVYPNRVYLWLVLPVAIALAFSYLINGGKAYGVISALIAAFQILIHQNGFLFYYWILGGIFLLGFLLRKYRRMLIKQTAFLLTLTTIVALHLLWLKWPYNQEFVHLATLPVWHQYYSFWYLNEQFYAFDPKGLLRPDMLIGLAIAIIAIYHALRAQTSTLPLVEIMLGTSFIIPFLIVYNPIVMPLIASVFSYTSVGRMLRIPLYYLAYGYGMVALFDGIKGLIKMNRSYRAFKVSIYLAVSGIFLFIAQPGYSVFQQLKFDHQMLPITRMVSYLKPGSLVLSDVLTSTDIVEFADVYTLVLQFNGPVDLVDISAGRQVVDQVLVQALPIETVIQILEREKIDYIVIDKESRLPKGILTAYSASFKTAYFDQRYVLYEIELSKDEQQVQ